MPELSAAQRRLDVVLLHQLLLEDGLGITPAAVTAEQNITYEREMGAALDAVDQQPGANLLPAKSGRGSTR